jgi:hypothetical protein
VHDPIADRVARVFDLHLEDERAPTVCIRDWCHRRPAGTSWLCADCAAWLRCDLDEDPAPRREPPPIIAGLILGDRAPWVRAWRGEA